MRRPWLPAVVLALLMVGPQLPVQAQTSAQLWEAYQRDPDRHPNIPNCSYAGYAAGEAALPEPRVVADVKAHGARGDGRTDDTAAFTAALAAAANAGGGAVLAPAGTYRIEGLVHMKYDGVVLRGEGPGRTILDFPLPLSKVVGPRVSSGKSAWSWCGGLVWIGPGDTFSADGKLIADAGAGQAPWEFWRPGPRLARATSAAKAGDRTLVVDSGARLKPGAMVLVTYANPPDFELLKAVCGVAAFDKYNWAGARWITTEAYPCWQWPVVIEAVKGNTVTLKQPLRLDVRPAFGVEFHELSSAVRGAGVERMTIRNHAPPDHRHLTNAGHNAVYVNRAYDCFVRDLEIRSTENGVVLAAAKNVTVTGIAFTGPEMHHHTLACRVNSHDNLFEDFVVDGPTRVKHGINTEWLSSGNVWRRATLKKGTFDSHRAISFDSIRTDITLRNDADGPGGDALAGPFLGKRVVHWNIRIEDSPRRIPGEFVNHPDCLPMGALVGIQGAARVDKPSPASAPGDKHCLIADEGVAPAIGDLYEAQLRLRIRK